MDTSKETKSRNFRLNIFFKITVSLLVFLLAFLVFYIAMSAFSTSRWVKDVNSGYSELVHERYDPQLINNQKYIALQNEIAFIKAQLSMAKTDSIGLIINIPDSTMALDISGVDVSVAKIINSKFSRSLYAIDHRALAIMLSEPLRITNSVASIEKEPIIDKVAQKDTTESSLPDKTREINNHEPVYFELTLENDFRILIIQQEELRKIDRFKFNLGLAVRRAIKDTKSILKFRLPDYSPVIQLIVSEKDARAIYRAIPEKGKICLFFMN
ncbi:MAG: hypothetical protein WBJ84_10515 [Bacteroidales bacterium]